MRRAGPTPRFYGRMAGHAPDPSPNRFRSAPPQPGRGETPRSALARLGGGQGERLWSRACALGEGARRGRRTGADRARGGARAAPLGGAAPDPPPAGVLFTGGTRADHHPRPCRRGARHGAGRHARKDAAAEEACGVRETEHGHESVGLCRKGLRRRARAAAALRGRDHAHDAFCRCRREARREVAARTLRRGDGGSEVSAKSRQFGGDPALSRDPRRLGEARHHALRLLALSGRERGKIGIEAGDDSFERTDLDPRIGRGRQRRLRLHFHRWRPGPRRHRRLRLRRRLSAPRAHRHADPRMRQTHAHAGPRGHGHAVRRSHRDPGGGDRLARHAVGRGSKASPKARPGTASPASRKVPS